MRDHLLLYINGQPTRVDAADAFLPLSDFLRRRQNLVGTKVVCAEGDCGSCSVLVGRADGQSIRYSAVTSCIQLMFQLDATHVITVEGLRDGSELNPIQRAMVECHGTQCGFCTPGFVVSLYDLMHDGRPVDANTVTRGFVGNLCRCTGYTPIVRAALETDRTTLKPLDTLYPPHHLLPALLETASSPIRLTDGPRTFCKPVTVDQALAFKSEFPTCTIVSGATDIGVQCNKRTRELTAVLSTAGLTALRTITTTPTHLHVGATATLSDFERITATALPELSQFLAWFGSPLIKNSGTLAGNLVNASPIGDTLPALMVLDAEVELTSPAGPRRINLNHFYTGYRTTALASNELLTAVHIPLPASGDLYRLYKVSRRKDLDISTFNAALRLRMTGATIDQAHLAFGGVGPLVLRLPKTESFLRGRPPTLDTFRAAAELAKTEVTPISDVRGSDTYRRTLAANILLKFWHETFGTHHPDRNDNHNGDGPNGHPTPIDVRPARNPTPTGVPQ